MTAANGKLAQVFFSDGICHVSGELDFLNSRQVLADATAIIHSHPELTFDFSGVTRSNSAGLALIIEFLAIARKKDHTVTFHHIPDSLRQLASVCQVDSLI